MLIPLLMLALQAAAPAQPAPAPAPEPATPPIQGLIRLFDAICNQGFPDDARLVSAMARTPAARPLTAAEVRGFLRDDPGRGWLLSLDPGSVIVTLEAPPVHACAIRAAGTDGRIDETLWRSVIDAAKAKAGGGFQMLPPTSFSSDGMRVAAIAEMKRHPDGSTEGFFLIRSTLEDPSKSPRFRTELRMVHQITVPGAAPPRR